MLPGSIGAYAGIAERKINLIDLWYTNRPEVEAIRLYAHKTIKDCYGDPGGAGSSGVGGSGAVLMLETARGQTYQSWFYQCRPLPDENLRNTTRLIFRLDEFPTLAAHLPTDDQFLYARVQEKIGGVWQTIGADPLLGPIYLVPDNRFFGTVQPTISVSSIAPENTGCTSGSAPVFNLTGLGLKPMNPMHLVYPRPLDSATIMNNDAPGGSNLLVALDTGQSMIQVPPQSSFSLGNGGFKEIVLAGESGAVPFAIAGQVRLMLA